MAIINFPPTAGQPTDGSFTYTFDGVLYSWTGSYWSANSQSGFDNRYVEVAGDVMTGDLTVPNLTATADVNAVNVIASDDIQSTSQNGSQLAGFRNQLINGGMDVWQRATTYDNTSTDAWLYRTVDRWALAGSQTGEGETKQVTSTAGSLTGMPEGFAYAFAYWDKTDTSTRSSMSQAIELPVTGGNCRGAGPFTPGSQWTLSCYCSADIRSIEARMEFSDSVQNVNPVTFGAATNWVEIEAPTSTRWGRYAITFTGSSNNFNTTTRCMRVILGAIGKQPTPADFTSVSSRVGITGVQLEPGPVATPFEHRPISVELSMCQRYYQTLKRLDMKMSVQTSSGNSRAENWVFATVMRAAPTVDFTRSGETSLKANTIYSDTVLFTGNTTSASNSLTALDIKADAEL